VLHDRNWAQLGWDKSDLHEEAFQNLERIELHSSGLAVANAKLQQK